MVLVRSPSYPGVDVLVNEHAHAGLALPHLLLLLKYLLINRIDDENRRWIVSRDDGEQYYRIINYSSARRLRFLSGLTARLWGMATGKSSCRILG